MKKIILSIILIFSCLFAALPEKSLAQTAKDNFNSGRDAAAQEMGYDDTETSIPEIIASVIKMLLTLLGIVFLMLMIYGGFKWMKASGREQDVQAAKKIIENAMIGLLIIIAAYAITAYVSANFVNKINQPISGIIIKKII